MVFHYQEMPTLLGVMLGALVCCNQAGPFHRFRYFSNHWCHIVRRCSVSWVIRVDDKPCHVASDHSGCLQPSYSNLGIATHCCFAPSSSRVAIGSCTPSVDHKLETVRCLSSTVHSNPPVTSAHQSKLQNAKTTMHITQLQAFSDESWPSTHYKQRDKLLLPYESCTHGKHEACTRTFQLLFASHHRMCKANKRIAEASYA